MRSMAGTPTSKSSTSGVAMLYGKFATRTHRSSPSSAGQSHDIASAWTISTLKDPTTSARAGSKCRSTSMAVTLAPVAASATVSDPRPAPISTTRSPEPTRARRAMRSATFGSARKFCPSDLDDRRPCFSSRAVSSARPGGLTSETCPTHATLRRKAVTAFSEVTRAISARERTFSWRSASPTKET